MLPRLLEQNIDSNGTANGPSACNREAGPCVSYFVYKTLYTKELQLAMSDKMLAPQCFITGGQC